MIIIVIFMIVFYCLYLNSDSQFHDHNSHFHDSLLLSKSCTLRLIHVTFTYFFRSGSSVRRRSRSPGDFRSARRDFSSRDHGRGYVKLMYFSFFHFLCRRHSRGGSRYDDGFRHGGYDRQAHV
jgi:hypothetical protein